MWELKWFERVASGHGGVLRPRHSVNELGGRVKLPYDGLGERKCMAGISYAPFGDRGGCQAMTNRPPCLSCKAPDQIRM